MLAPRLYRALVRRHAGDPTAATSSPPRKAEEEGNSPTPPLFSIARGLVGAFFMGCRSDLDLLNLIAVIGGGSTTILGFDGDF